MKKRIICLLLALGMLLGATSGVCAAGSGLSVDSGYFAPHQETLSATASVTQAEISGNTAQPMAAGYATYMPYITCAGQAVVKGQTMIMYALAYVPDGKVSQNWNADIYYGEVPSEDGYIGTATGGFGGKSGYLELEVDWDTTGEKTGAYTVVYYTTYESGSNMQVVEESIATNLVYVEQQAIEVENVYLADFNTDGYPMVERLCLQKGASEVTDYFIRFDPERATCWRDAYFASDDESVLEVASFGGFLAYNAKEYGDLYIVAGGLLATPVRVEICTDDQGHNYEEAVTLQPTCMEPGEKTQTCTKCGYVNGPLEVLPLGHTWDEGEVIREDPEKEYVEIRYTCTVCGEQETRGSSTCPGQVFTDMPAQSNWAHKGIDYCLTNGLMQGMGGGKFEPKGVTTRGQLVTILWRQAGSPEPEGTAPFTDLTQQYYRKAVAWAYETGVVKGITETTFAPSQPVTREQFATFVYRYVESVLELDVSARADLSVFPDYEDAHEYSGDALAWANAEGLIAGVATGGGTVLQPRGNTTRAQAATILMRFCQNLEQAPESPETPAEDMENP